jgi:molybdenum cofactor cytidylyltransferase
MPDRASLEQTEIQPGNISTPSAQVADANAAAPSELEVGRWAFDVEGPIATILLAAGDSSRLGRPKQLVPFGEGTLLRHAAQTALAAELGPVIVVLGAVEDQCRNALVGLPLTILVNSNWSEGMGTSIAAGMQGVSETSERGVIVALCDQPAITPAHLRSLAETQRSSGKSIIASRYAGTLGPPAFFASSRFSQLRLLKGPHGAKVLFQDSAQLTVVDCMEGAFDIDTEADVARLTRIS